MSELTTQTQNATMVSASSATELEERVPQRIQVSCISEAEAAFPPPRPFSFQRNEQSACLQGSISPKSNIAKQADDFLDRSSRYVRRVGYALILASVLLLILDGLFHNTLGL